MEFFFCRHESDAGELQFFHPVATKITRDSREETSGASPRQPVPGEIQKIFNFVVPRFRAFLDPQKMREVKLEKFQSIFLLTVLALKYQFGLFIDVLKISFYTNKIFQASFNLQVDPLSWGPDKIFFQTCDNLDELILVVSFILKHNLEVSGKLVATFYK